jgi:hypothetical protein
MINSFIKQFVAILKGDDAEVTAQKNFRKAHAAIKTQISSKTADTVDLEDKLETAKENLRLAYLNNGKDITDRNEYVRNLFKAKNNLNEAEDTLDQHKADLLFLEDSLKAMEAE